jgi:hypothetical protein
MSHEHPSIPYCYLAIPYEFLTEDFLKDPIMIRFVVWMMNRIRPYPTKIPLKDSLTVLLLEPFEFMFGRNKCAEDARISAKNARTRISQLISLRYVEEVSCKRAAKYTVYRLMLTSFRLNAGQHKVQSGGQQKEQPLGHNRKTEMEEEQSIKGTINYIRNNDCSPLSNEEEEALIALTAYCESRSLKIYEKSIRRWITQYGVEHINAHLGILMKEKNVKNPEAWMETALRCNYVQKNNNIQVNREFIINFCKEKRWNSLRITKAYCTHEPSGKDYKFDLSSESFKKMIIDCYNQYEGAE